MEGEGEGDLVGDFFWRKKRGERGEERKLL